MKINRPRTSGFTLVELLIVVVIIAILAAITTVAYNGVQKRANNAAVQSDIKSFAKTIELIRARDGSIPAGGSATGDSTKFPGVTFRPSKGSYATNFSNFTIAREQLAVN